MNSRDLAFTVLHRHMEHVVMSHMGSEPAVNACQHAAAARAAVPPSGCPKLDWAWRGLCYHRPFPGQKRC